jgi:hypothetical protein
VRKNGEVEEEEGRWSPARTHWIGAGRAQSSWRYGARIEGGGRLVDSSSRPGVPWHVVSRIYSGEVGEGDVYVAELSDGKRSYVRSLFASSDLSNICVPNSTCFCLGVHKVERMHVL